MKTHYKEKCVAFPQCEIRAGESSWDDGSKTARSIKYAWFDSFNRACRGGEVPVEALPQMVEVAIKCGYLKKSDFN